MADSHKVMTTKIEHVDAKVDKVQGEVTGLAGQVAALQEWKNNAQQTTALVKALNIQTKSELEEAARKDKEGTK